MKIRLAAKLLIFQIKILLINLKSALFPIVLTIILISGFIFWIHRAEEVKPQVLICNEEDSFLARTVISSILSDRINEIVRFESTDYEAGRKSVDGGEAILLIHIKKGTMQTLYSGKKAVLDLYTADSENDFSKLLINYVAGFTDVINVAQNAGLSYMEMMYEKGMTEEEGIEKFNELQNEYVKKIITRNSLFAGENELFGLSEREIEASYNLFVALFALTVSFSIIINSRILSGKIVERLVLSGYTRAEIYTSALLIMFFTGMAAWYGLINAGYAVGIGG